MKNLDNFGIKISVLLVTRNEQNYISKCIKSIIAQFNSFENWELLIIDGCSTDSTISTSEMILKQTNVNYKFITNHNKILSAGWNLGLKNAIGKYVIRPDAHSELLPGYIERGVSILEQNQEITAVGGLLITKGNGFWGNLIKDALSSRVGVGNSSFRTGTTNKFVDTVVYGIYRKDIFQKVGYFNENLVRHQDNEMHKRITDNQGKFYLCNEMKAVYYCRDSLGSLCRQMFLIGYYLPFTGFKYFRIRHLAPVIFQLTIFFASIFLLVLPEFKIFLISLLITYFSIISFEFTRKAIFKRNIALLLNIVTVPLIHASYGIGTLYGIICKLFCKSKKL